jgi:hypothetical protein
MFHLLNSYLNSFFIGVKYVHADSCCDDANYEKNAKSMNK